MSGALAFASAWLIIASYLQSAIDSRVGGLGSCHLGRRNSNTDRTVLLPASLQICYSHGGDFDHHAYCGWFLCVCSRSDRLETNGSANQAMHQRQ